MDGRNNEWRIDFQGSGSTVRRKSHNLYFALAEAPAARSNGSDCYNGGSDCSSDGSDCSCIDTDYSGDSSKGHTSDAATSDSGTDSVLCGRIRGSHRGAVYKIYIQRRDGSKNVHS